MTFRVTVVHVLFGGSCGFHEERAEADLAFDTVVAKESDEVLYACIQRFASDGSWELVNQYFGNDADAAPREELVSPEYQALITKALASERAVTIALRTQDAYSYDRYGEVEWTVAAELLLGRFITAHHPRPDAAAEAVLRSKTARWAGDWYEDIQGKVRGEAITLYMDMPRNASQYTATDIAKLIEGTPQCAEGFYSGAA